MHCTKFQKSNINKESHDRINKGNKLFLCFRPVVMDGSGSVNGSRGNSNSFVKYIEMNHKDGVVFPRMYPALSSSPKSPFLPTMEKDAAGHRKKKTKRKFLRAVKAVLFETTLAKRIKKKAFPGKTKQSKGDPSAKAEKNLMGSSSFQSLSRKNDGTNVTFAPIMNSSARTSRNSSLNSTISKSDRRLPFESYNNSMETKKNLDMKQEKFGKGHYSSNAGLFLLLVTLLVLVFWGKDQWI
ncbi:uncharacterized protein LOC110641378 isoform X2 [Hevea brasiliensis]|uniref:uncharacterized protein LOC110641378 isoform X2 n=1 Tax=Hevea brasiliensis TaxID=3981 RepID=UPI0025F65E53|nr:uncharacterized protein LOC110641378 isoform X2 [Hevea brasiliensis]